MFSALIQEWQLTEGGTPIPPELLKKIKAKLQQLGVPGGGSKGRWVMMKVPRGREEKGVKRGIFMGHSERCSCNIQERKDLLKGGLADKSKPSDFDPKQLAMGIEVEREHSSNPKIAREVAMDHLKEIPDYYTRLKAMEKEAESRAEKSEAKFQAKFLPPGSYHSGSDGPDPVQDSRDKAKAATKAAWQADNPQNAAEAHRAAYLASLAAAAVAKRHGTSDMAAQHRQNARLHLKHHKKFRTKEAERRLKRKLPDEPSSGVMKKWRAAADKRQPLSTR
jgi:hypothetical protein